jgi:hypothetical protein
MDVWIDARISLLEQAKIQAQVLVPVLRALRAELGKARADAIVLGALREWSRAMFRRIGETIPGTPREKWETMNAAVLPRIGNDVDVETLRQDDEALDFNVTGCRYADFFRQLGEPELGVVLMCEADRHMEEVAASEVSLARSQTIMTGASHCDFRFKMKRT